MALTDRDGRLAACKAEVLAAAREFALWRDVAAKEALLDAVDRLFELERGGE